MEQYDAAAIERKWQRVWDDAHAFEVENPGDTVTRTFTADKTGSFQIEIEDTSTEIGSLEVQPG